MATLSDAAIEILQLAVSTDDDTVMLVDMLGGSSLDVAGTDLFEGKDRASIARYRSAVRELFEAGLIEDRAGKGEVFFVTGPGYDVARNQTN